MESAKLDTGQYPACRHARFRCTSTVALAAADGSATRDLVAGTQGTLSPDGGRLLVVGAGGRVVITNASGFGSRPFTPDGMTDAAPAWSPT